MEWINKTKRSNTAQKSTGLGGWSPLAPWVNADRGDQLSRTKWGAAKSYIVIGYVEKCVELIASGITSLPYSIKRFGRGIAGTDERWTGTEVARSDDPIPQHPLFQLFHAYEDHQHMSLLFRVAASLTLFDELYIELVRKLEDRPVSQYNPLMALDWLNPMGMSINASNGRIDQYFYSPFDTSRPATYKPFEIAYKHGYNPEDDLRGYPDVLAVLESLEIDFAIQRSVVSHFRNGIQSSAIVSPKEGFSSLSMARDAMEDVKKRSRGPENLGGFAYWPRGIDVTALPYPDYSQITTYSQKTGERILNQFGVPEAMLGNSDIAGYKQGDETTYRFYTGNIIPRADDIIKFFNRRIIPLLPAEYHLDRLVVDRSEFDRVSENDEREASITGQNLQNTIITINEARLRQGLEEWEAERGDLLIVQPGTVFVSPDDLKSGFVAGGTPEEAAVVGQTSDVDDGDLPPLPPEGGEPPPFPSTEPEVTKAKAQGNDAYVYIDLAERDELLAIQRKLKGIIGESADIEWQEPDTFHVTLAYAPDISDRELEARTINSIDEFKLGDNPLEIKEMGIFDTDDGQALHLVVNNSAALDSLQSRIVDELKGIELSEYSNPDDYNPHITMAYVPNEITIPDIEIEPFALGIDRVVYGREYYNEVHAVEALPPGQKSNLIAVKAVMARSQSSIDNWDWTVEKAHKELDAWYTFIKRRGLKRLAEFRPNYTRGDIADTILESFKGYSKSKSGLTVKAIFGMVKDWAAVKAIQATRIDFEDDFEDTLQANIDGKATRRQASARLRSIIRKANNKAYRDGLTDGGALGEEPTDAEQVEINQFISEQSQYVKSLLGTVKSEKLTSSQGKGKEWYNKSVSPMYDAGFASAGGNKMSEWVLGKTEKHCKSCSGYNGQRHRFKSWLRIGAMPKSDTLACNGFNCDCALVPVRAKARGKLKLIKSIQDLMKDGKFEEAEHPRGEGGEFTSGGGSGGGSSEDDKPEGENETTSEAMGTSSAGTEFIPKGQERNQTEPPEDAFDVADESDWESDMTEGERASIESWSDNSWDSYQNFAQNPEALASASPEQKKAFADFETAVDDAPQYTGTTWRGVNMRNKSREQVIEQFNDDIGNTMSFDTYSSASASSRTAGSFSTGKGVPVIFEVYSNQGQYINAASSFGPSSEQSEQEVIFKPNSEFVVRDVFDGTFNRGPNRPGESIIVVLEDAS